MATYKSPKKKHTLADYLKVYKKRFMKLDKKTRIQLIVIAVLLVRIFFTAITALFGRGKNPASSSEIIGNTVLASGSYDPQADEKYEDEVKEILKEIGY